MPNNSYLRSRQKERDLVNTARARGSIACRSAGSKSPFDVWEVNHKDKEVVLTQVKTTKGSRHFIQRDVKVYPGYTVITRIISYI